MSDNEKRDICGSLVEPSDWLENEDWHREFEASFRDEDFDDDQIDDFGDDYIDDDLRERVERWNAMSPEEKQAELDRQAEQDRQYIEYHDAGVTNLGSIFKDAILNGGHAKSKLR